MDKDTDPYQELVTEKSPYLFCDWCRFYPIEPVHGHFRCPSCRMLTRCCEGGPMEIRLLPQPHLICNRISEQSVGFLLQTVAMATL